MSLAIAPFDSADEEKLYRAFAAVVEEGGGYPQGPPTTLDGFRAVWLEPTVAVRVARWDGEFAGAYYLKPNFPGRAAHIANAGYLVVPATRGRGVGEALVLDSFDIAREHGFDALMFNLVFESNPARRPLRAPRVRADRPGARRRRGRGRADLLALARRLIP